MCTYPYVRPYSRSKMERVTKRATGLFLLACIVATSLLTGVESRPQNGVFRNLMLKVDETVSRYRYIPVLLDSLCFLA